MSDNNGLPKATMANFIKQHISDKRKVSAEFTNLLLQLSKQFIDKVSAQANQICQKQGKKTINNEHFFHALKELGMGDIISHLQKIDQSIKIKQKKKLQQKQKFQQNFKTLMRRQSQMQEQKQKQKVPILQPKHNKKPVVLDDQQQQDFVYILEQDQDHNQK